MSDENKNTPSAPAEEKQIVLQAHPVIVGKDSFESGLLAGPGKRTGKEGKAIQSNALEYEDDFKGLYEAGGQSSRGLVIIEPPYNPLTLEKMAKHNNTLGPCIEAMKVNIDGTGFEIIKPSEEKTKDQDEGLSDEEEEEIQQLKCFFQQPWPGTSFTPIRKKLRQDLETIGYGFLEVIRNPAGKIIFIRHVEAKTVRLIKLDSPHKVTKEITRGCMTENITMNLRFRRFVQKVGTHLTYFKEFECPLDLDRRNGKWVEEDDSNKLPWSRKASELIYFTVDKDVNSPYGVPRWISQTPSILGSRKAEENNLAFFNSGGIPPFILIVKGGVLAKETRDALESGLATNGDQKQRGLVVEAHSSSGSLDDKNTVDVKVERFGGEKTKDSQFEGYDARCSDRVRRAFRLPPIFIGSSSEYNFASMFAGYMVGEAQVFKPERDEFDEIMTMRLIPILLKKKEVKYRFRSLPIVVNDAKEKIMAVKVAGDKKAISPAELVRNLNEITGLEMVPSNELTELADTLDDDNEEWTSDSSLTDASTSAPNEAQGISGNKQ